MTVYRVAVGDDDDAFREALVATLEADRRFEVVGSATGGEELCQIVAATGADLAVVDVRMPQGGVVAIRGLREQPASRALGDVDPGGPAAGPVIVVLSAHEAVSDIVELVDAGATGYLVKGRLSGNALPDLLARCADGEVVLAAPRAARALRRLLESSPSGH